MFPSALDPVGAVLALINATNPTLYLALSPTNVRLGMPQSLPVPAPGSVNTVVTVSAIDGQGYSRSAEVYYRRHDLTTYFSDQGISPTLESDFSWTGWADFLGALNARYGTAFGTRDLPFAAFSNNVVSIHYQAPATSLLFTGSCDIPLTNSGLALASALTVLALPGLNPPLAQ